MRTLKRRIMSPLVRSFDLLNNAEHYKGSSLLVLAPNQVLAVLQTLRHLQTGPQLYFYLTDMHLACTRLTQEVQPCCTHCI